MDSRVVRETRMLVKRRATVNRSLEKRTTGELRVTAGLGSNDSGSPAVDCG